MDSQRAIPIPGGIADAEANVCYVAASGGGMDAIDLRSGSTLWHTDEASQPLAAAQGQVAAVRTVPGNPGWLQAVVLDARAGGDVVVTSAPIGLPSWVETDSADPDALTLDADLGGGRLVLRWEAHGRYRGGASPPRALEAHAQGDASGTAEVDLRTGEVSTGDSLAEAPRLPPPALEAFTDPASDAPIAYQMGTSWKTGPWAAEHARAALRPGPQGGVVLTTRRAEDGGLSESPISDDPDAEVRVTLDGAYVLVRGAAAGAEEGESWELVPTRSPGDRSTLGLRSGAHNFSVAGGTLIYIADEPGPGQVRRLMVAHDLTTGEPLWERELSTFSDAGPPPLAQGPPPPA